MLAVEEDAKDPQFMSKLNRLSPVQVDHHMRPVRPVRVFRNYRVVPRSYRVSWVVECFTGRIRSEYASLSHSV